MTQAANLELSAALSAAESDAVDPDRGPRGARGRLSSAQANTGRLFLLPNFGLVFIFLLIPLVLSFWYSLQKLDSFGNHEFLAFNNYVDLFSSGEFWQSMSNTLLFTVITVPVGMGLGLALAVLLNGVLPGRTLYRSIIFLPLVISGVATGVLGQWMFDENNGFFNRLIGALGFTGPHWQSDGHWAMTSIILMTIWQRVGFDMIIYLAGLQGVSPELSEAATVDGASAWQRFRTITFPLLGPSTFFLVIMNLIYSFQVFDTIWAMTRGGPDFSTTTVVVEAYRRSFDDHGPQQLGYGAAIGVVIYLITLLVTGAQWRLARNRDQTG